MTVDATCALRLQDRPRVSADPDVTLFAQGGPLFRADRWPQSAECLVLGGGSPRRGPSSCLMRARPVFRVRPVRAVGPPR